MLLGFGVRGSWFEVRVRTTNRNLEPRTSNQTSNTEPRTPNQGCSNKATASSSRNTGCLDAGARFSVSPAVDRREPRGQRRFDPFRRARRVRDLLDVRAAWLLARRAQPLPHRLAGHALVDRRAPRVLWTNSRASICSCCSGAGISFRLNPVLEMVSRTADTRLRVLIVDTCQADDRLQRLDEALGAIPVAQRPVTLVSCARDGRTRENSVHGFFTGGAAAAAPAAPSSRCALAEPARRVRSRGGGSGRPHRAGTALHDQRRGTPAHSDPHAERAALRVTVFDPASIGSCNGARLRSRSSVARKMRRASVRMRTSSSSVRPGL